MAWHPLEPINKALMGMMAMVAMMAIMATAMVVMVILMVVGEDGDCMLVVLTRNQAQSHAHKVFSTGFGGYFAL